jgi:predicted transposase/invertase (TIGR01784 family)
MNCGKIRRFYLDEMEELTNPPLGLSILHLIRQSESNAPFTARELISRVKKEIGNEAHREDLIELIEMTVIYKLSHLSREEVRTMLQIQDIRESRFYQEVLKEGKEEGIAFAIERMAANKMSAEQIATILKLDIEQVRQAIAKAEQS